MILESIKELFVRDLEKVKAELMLYGDESNLWLIEEGIKNSGGNLCLHLIGNLKTYIGHGLAKVDYQRDREFEFNGRGISRDQMMEDLNVTIELVKQGIDNVSQEDLQKDFPIIIWAEPSNMAFTILHLHSHLNYHLGQLNYHRRMLDKN